VPTEYRSRDLGACSIDGHRYRLRRVLRQRTDDGEIEPPAESRSSNRRTRRVAWSGEPAPDVPRLVRPLRAEGG
jgi:hypothetical protein